MTLEQNPEIKVENIQFLLHALMKYLSPEDIEVLGSLTEEQARVVSKSHGLEDGSTLIALANDYLKPTNHNRY